MIPSPRKPTTLPAFRSASTQKVKRELLIFLTPHVAQAPKDLTGISKEELQNNKLAPEAVEKGAYDRHIKAMAPTTQPTEP